MSNEVNKERVARIVKRIKGAIKVRNTIEEYNIHEWIDTYTAMLSDIITLKENEFDIFDSFLVNAVFDELREAEKISIDDIFLLRDIIKRKKKEPSGDLTIG